MSSSPDPRFVSRAPASLDELKRSSVRSGSVTAFAQALNLLIHLASTVVLARLLSPAEFGVISMVLTVTLFARLFRDLGLSSSTIQRASLTHEQVSTLFWINLAVGAALTSLVAASAPVVAWFFGRPELKAVTLWLSLSFLISSLGTQPGALLARSLRFGLTATANLAGALATFGVTAYLASRGQSYWSIVFGNLIGTTLTSGLLLALAGWRPGLPRRGHGVRGMLRYGLNLTGFEFVNYFSRNLDNILIGKFAGPDALGLYTKAYNLLMLPITNLRGPITNVAFAAMSRLQERPEEFRRYYCSVVFVLAVTSMPVVGGLYVVSDPLIRIVLGERWAPAAGLFSILAFAGFLQTSSGFRGTVLMSLGLGRRYFMQGLYSAIVGCTGFLIGIRWGASGVATAYAITSLLLPYPMHVYSFKGTPLRVGDFFGTVAGPALAAIVAAAAMVPIRVHAFTSLGDFADLLASIVLYVALYSALLVAHGPSRRRLGQTGSFILTALGRR